MKTNQINLSNVYNYEATHRVLKALLEDHKDISSKDSETRFLTTRITNVINGLRNSGIDIETKTVKIEKTKKHYGRYVLVQDDENIKRAILLLEKIEVKLVWVTQILN